MEKGKWLVAAAVGAVALTSFLWLRPSGSGSDAADAAPVEAPAEGAASKGPARIAISADQAKGLALQFAAAVPATGVPVATLPALIAPPPNARVAVAAQLPGIVTRVHVVEGDVVHAGQTLALVSSRDMVSLGSDLARAKARLAVAQANAGRIGQLSREGIVAKARADEAQAALREAEIDVREHGRLIGMTNGSAGGSYALTAPISGRISAMTIETGKALDPGAVPFVIDGAGPLQAQAQLPERLIGKVHPGMTVTGGPDVTGEVVAVGTSLDPRTRSASVTARIPQSAALRSGQSLTLSVMGPAPDGAVQVPGVAVTTKDGKSIVFVQTAGGVQAREVTLGESSGGGDVPRVVLSGLKSGERVAITAVSELKSLAAGD